MVLCANKTDLPEEMWEVSREQFNLFAEENKLAIFETSASSGTRVDEVSLSTSHDFTDSCPFDPDFCCRWSTRFGK
jgi:GTPase SAR1 family protein